MIKKTLGWPLVLANCKWVQKSVRETIKIIGQISLKSHWDLIEILLRPYWDLIASSLTNYKATPCSINLIVVRSKTRNAQIGEMATMRFTNFFTLSWEFCFLRFYGSSSAKTVLLRLFIVLKRRWRSKASKSSKASKKCKKIRETYSISGFTCRWIQRQ